MVLVDFIILNSLLLGFINFESQYIPDYLDLRTKITFFIANVALAIGEYNYSTLIHIRRIGFQQVLKRTLFLVLCTTVCFMIFLKFFSHGGEIFAFGFYFGIPFYLALIISRIIELKVLKHHRAKGRNCRTVIFVGSDPAVREMYITMTEDPSAGYIVKGYYADDVIAGAPQELKKLGTMQDLDKILESKMNDTINGSCYGLDEIFCSLSHQELDQIVKIMRFCDKNVVHFYYLPRLFGEYKLHLDSHNFMGKTVYTNHLEPLSSVSNRILKRAFDIAVSGVICLCFLPFIPIIALIIKIQSPGPIFFRQARTLVR